MFGGGKWLNTYEIPFFGNSYLEAKYKDKWSIGSAKDSLGGFASFGAMLGMDFPARPKFSVKMDSSSRPEITSTFYLVNVNETWLKRNFEFIQAIFAGTSWLHLKYCIVRSPNVYQVLCPGRFQMIYAAMNSEVTFEGKLRKIPSVSKYYNNEMGIKSVDDDTLWPDAWKITLSIRDLTPNNFNMYANYYINGFVPDDMKMLSDQFGLPEMAESLKNFFTGLGQDIVGGSKRMMKDAGSQVKKLLTTMQGGTSALTNSENLENGTFTDKQINAGIRAAKDRQLVEETKIAEEKAKENTEIANKVKEIREKQNK